MLYNITVLSRLLDIYELFILIVTIQIFEHLTSFVYMYINTEIFENLDDLYLSEKTQEHENIKRTKIARHPVNILET